MRLVVYPQIERKLADKHGVAVFEVEQAFLNRSGGLASETRSKNQGAYPRFWFISETDTGRRLKVVYVNDPTEPDGPVIITAYPPNPTEEAIYASI